MCVQGVCAYLEVHHVGITRAGLSLVSGPSPKKAEGAHGRKAPRLSYREEYSYNFYCKSNLESGKGGPEDLPCESGEVL